MRYRQARVVFSFGRTAVGLVLGVICGCALVPPNSFLDPTKVGQYPLDAKEGGIRRILSPRETPPGIASATEPTPDDLIPTYDEYRVAPGDTVQVIIPDLLTPGQPYGANLEVDATGEIRLPDVGSIKITGLTETEIEQEIAARLKEGGLLPRPAVQVSTQLKRGRLFHMMGAVRQSGPYPIGQPDLRLLEAIGMAGDVDATARKMYVIRRAAGPKAAAPDSTAPEERGEDGLVIPPPTEEQEPAPAPALSSASGHAWQEPPPDAPPPTREELADVLNAPTSQTRPATSNPTPTTREKPAFEPIVIFDPQTGEVLTPEPKPSPEPAAQAKPAPSERELEQPFQWEAVEDAGFDQRVIAIDVVELKAGNPRYNIVVRDRDVLNVPVDTGVFYIMGEVVRPGVFAFGGRDVTVKQAMAICGGFSPLAWPQRCELIRREPGTDKQFTRAVNLDAIFAGLEEDFYLRDDDILNVGSHTLAPFLYVIRNSFRFTYGFGFVYDRNFADKDSYGSRINPEILRQERRQARGLSF
jgi:polysaccharide biosynthesis/export protein